MEEKDSWKKLFTEILWIFASLPILLIVGGLIILFEYLWSNTLISLIGIPIIIWLSTRERKKREKPALFC